MYLVIKNNAVYRRGTAFGTRIWSTCIAWRNLPQSDSDVTLCQLCLLLESRKSRRWVTGQCCVVLCFHLFVCLLTFLRNQSAVFWFCLIHVFEKYEEAVWKNTNIKDFRTLCTFNFGAVCSRITCITARSIDVLCRWSLSTAVLFIFVMRNA